LNLKSNSLLKIRAKRSSSETLIKRSAPDTDRNGAWINGAKIFPELISDLLTDGHMVKFRAPGDSMYPTICDCDLITVEPMEPSDIRVNDIILYRHENGVVAHRVINIEAPQSSALSPQHFFTVRGDAAINHDAPVSSEQILGKVVSIERNGRRIDPYNFRVRLLYKARRFVACVKRSLIGPSSKSAEKLP
jgi:hypothetical protein